MFFLSQIASFSYCFAQSIWSESSSTDWSDGVLANTTWYPNAQAIQLDWEGSSFTTYGHSPNELWLAGWKFRRKITINNSLSYGLSDYQVWIPTSAFGSNWDLIRSSAQPDMDDFRFTPSTSANTFPYWIEDNTNTPRGFWVRISTLPAGNNTIYMYYGNLSVSSASNGTNTFIFFDDFNLDLSKWSRTTGSSISNGWLKSGNEDVGHGGTNYIYSNTDLSVYTKWILEFLSKASFDNLGGTIIFGANATTPQHYGQQHETRTGGNDNDMLYKNGTTTGWLADYRIEWDVNEVVRNKILKNDTDSFSHYRFSISNSTRYTAGGFNGSGLIPIKFIGFSSFGSNCLEIDFIFLRSYAPTEPTISSVGSEEGAFFSSGAYRSNVLDCGSKIVVSSISWNPVSQPAGTKITVGIRVSSFPFSINSSTPAFVEVSNGQSLNWHGRYIQYISTFTTNYSTSTPHLEDISIVYRVKPWQEKSIIRSGNNSFGFGGGESWSWQIPVKSGSPLTVSCYIRYNSEYQGSSYTKPKLTLSGKGISTTSVSATSAAENAWELLTINAGTPTESGILNLKAEGFSNNPGARFWIDDIQVSQ